jgi:hypothetical protein
MALMSVPLFRNANNAVLDRAVNITKLCERSAQ